MECLIHLLSLCVLDPNNVYVKGDFDFTHHLKTEGAWCTNHWCQGPRATMRVGATLDLTRAFQIDYGLQHTSFVNEADRGAESLYVTVEWRPFR